MRVILLSWLIVGFTCVTGSGQPSPHEMDNVPVADVHLHLLDFLQNGSYLLDGKEVPPTPGDTLPAGARHLRLHLLLQRMNESNVSHAMVSGMPFVKKWSENETFRSTYYLHSTSRVTRARDTDYAIALAFEDFRRQEPERFAEEFPRLYPFICGFNETDLGAVATIVKRIKEFPGLWKGIGEVMSRHDDLTNLTLGERPRADHPALLRVYDFAGEFGLPVLIHHNVAPISPNGVDTQRRYLNELQQVFQEFPNTQFIWCHSGISRRIVVDDLVDIVDAGILADHSSHVSIDLSWVVFEDYLVQKDADGAMIRDSEGDPEIRKEWISLIEKYPTSFMLGSDKVGKFHNYRDEIRRYNVLLKVLSPETRKLVARDNAIRVMPKQGLTLPDGYLYPETRYTKRTLRARD